MSWWTKLRDTAIKTATLGIVDPEASRHAESDQRYMINQQIKAYKEQTELTKKELANKRNETLAEKRRIEEKQIRNLRRNYRTPGGMLGQGAPAAGDMSSQLGG